jgi:hypothetical protein
MIGKKSPPAFKLRPKRMTILLHKGRTIAAPLTLVARTRLEATEHRAVALIDDWLCSGALAAIQPTHQPRRRSRLCL